jgi:hypothetical protein
MINLYLGYDVVAEHENFIVLRSRRDKTLHRVHKTVTMGLGGSGSNISEFLRHHDVKAISILNLDEGPADRAIIYADDIIISRDNVIEVVPPGPPSWAEYAVNLFAPAKRREALVGDLEERFAKDCERLGEKRARRKYCIRAIRELGPVLLQWLKKIGGVVGIIDLARKVLGI